MKRRNRNITTPLVTVCAIVGMLALAVFANVAHAGPIPLNTFLQFSFESVGTPAIGCDPADPAGPSCVPSSGAPSTFLDAPPWTFAAPVGGVTFAVTDAFTAGDRFEVFNFGVSLGLTSAFVTGADCGDDAAVCGADSNMSRGIFALTEGNHSITILPTAVSSDIGGSGFFIATAAAQQVPEPTSALLLAAAGIAGWTSSIRLQRRRRRKAATT